MKTIEEIKIHCEKERDYFITQLKLYPKESKTRKELWDALAWHYNKIVRLIDREKE